MFKFTHVLDTANGVRYFISAAKLIDENYNSASWGSNTYEIDLVGEGCYDNLLSGVTLCICNSGNLVQITRGLDPSRATHKDESGNLQEDMMDTLIEGDTIIASSTRHVEGDALLRLTHIPPMSADEAAGMIKALTAVMEAEGCTGNEIEDMADDIRHLLKQGEAAR